MHISRTLNECFSVRENYHCCVSYSLGYNWVLCGNSIMSEERTARLPEADNRFIFSESGKEDFVLYSTELRGIGFATVRKDRWKDSNEPRAVTLHAVEVNSKHYYSEYRIFLLEELGIELREREIRELWAAPTSAEALQQLAAAFGEDNITIEDPADSVRPGLFWMRVQL